MNKETLRMQMLSGIITESEYKAKIDEVGKYSLMKNSSKEARDRDIEQSDREYIVTRQQRDKVADKMFGKTYKECDERQKGKVRNELKKNPLNENFVGVGAINNPFAEREKTDYELAFEHFTKGTSLNEIEEDLDENKKPGTAKERSVMAKKARVGKDIGKKGKNFEKITKSAGEKYGSEEAGKRVAGAIMYGKLKEDSSESVTLSFTPEPFTVTFDVVDFENEEKFQEFKNKLISDENFAFDSFFGNFEGQDFEDQLDRQNQDNWKLDII